MFAVFISCVPLCKFLLRIVCFSYYFDLFLMFWGEITLMKSNLLFIICSCGVVHSHDFRVWFQFVAFFMFCNAIVCCAELYFALFRILMFSFRFCPHMCSRAIMFWWSENCSMIFNYFCV